MCLIGKTQLLCMQCRGIGPNLVAREKSHGFSRVAAGTCGIFSSCDVIQKYWDRSRNKKGKNKDASLRHTILIFLT